MNEIKGMVNNPTIHSVKHLLDELNYLSYIAVNALHEKIGENDELQFFFLHIYPGASVDKYKEIFGDPNRAIVRKRYVDEAQCEVAAGGSTFKTLDAIGKQTKIKDKVGGAVGGSKAPKPSVDVPATPSGAHRGPRSLEEAKYSGVLLNSVKFHPAYLAPIQGFEDAYYSRVSESSSGEGARLSDKPKITRVIQFWKYPYYKKARG